MSRWKDVDVGCPFYSSSDVGSAGCVVRCEGITEGGQLIHRFRDREQLEAHMRSYCSGRYICCEIYRMLMDLYED